MKRLTSIEDIRGAAAAKEVALTGWNPDEAFVCKLRKPGLFAMQMKGGIPNPVLAVVQDMFAAKTKPAKDAEAEKNTAQAFYHIARAALVAPTMDELEAAGVELTDRQYTEIYAFVLGGAQGIARFRQSIRPGAGKHVEKVPDAPVGADGADGSDGDVDGGRGDSFVDDADGEGEKAENPTGERNGEVG